MTNQLLGTVSHGTMRPQDLIPCFLEVLEIVAPDEYAGLMSAAFPPVPTYVFDEGDDAEWWHDEDAQYLLEYLFNALDQYAPEGCYFGAHPGDGSDYGFWPIEAED